MTGAHGAHPGFPGHVVLAWRSAGVRALLELSPPADSRKLINFKHRLIIWGGNCKSNISLSLVGVHPFFSRQTRGHFPFCSPLLFAICLSPSIFSCIYLVIVMEDISFCVRRNQDAEVEQEWSREDNRIPHMCDCTCMVLLSAS